MKTEADIQIAITCKLEVLTPTSAKVANRQLTVAKTTSVAKLVKETEL